MAFALLHYIWSQIAHLWSLAFCLKTDILKCHLIKLMSCFFYCHIVHLLTVVENVRCRWKAHSCAVRVAVIWTVFYPKIPSHDPGSRLQWESADGPSLRELREVTGLSLPNFGKGVLPSVGKISALQWLALQLTHWDNTETVSWPGQLLLSYRGRCLGVYSIHLHFWGSSKAGKKRIKRDWGEYFAMHVLMPHYFSITIGIKY